VDQRSNQVPQLELPPPQGEDVRRPVNGLRRSAAFVLYNIVAVLLLLLLAEGVTSVYFTFRGAFANPDIAERLHTEYDRELGWINLPNVYLPNMYGPGKFLRTNSQRFRNDADFSKNVPPDKVRVICSGDSFTLGFGVDNKHTWPYLLAAQAPNLEAVNMGQGGYGADQAYLWYKRDGVNLDHDIQIFALVFPDAYRMQHAEFVGYGKPVLAVENGHVVATNVPVPRTTKSWSPRLERMENALSNLSITRLLHHAFGLGGAPFGAASGSADNQETSRVLSAMLDDLHETNRAKNSVLVLAYLPIREELTGQPGAPWRGFLAEYARQHHLLYLDLTDDFRRLPPAEMDKLFIGGGDVDFLGAEGHYTEAGNEFVAGLIYRRLQANPETAAKLRTQP